MSSEFSDPVKFLIVDDTPQNLVALDALLRRDGLEILHAHSGPEALELLLSHEIALALLDVHMPNMDGFELAELMRGTERTKHVPIIFVTAAASDPHRLFKGYESGAVDFLFKPIEPHALKSKADVFFDLFQQRRELSNSLRLNEMFVGIVGHDLRGPLSTIFAGARLLEKENTSEEGQVILGRMIRAAGRMNGMLTQMMDFTGARLGGGVVRSRSRVDVTNLVQSVIEEIRGSHPHKEIFFGPADPCLVNGDSGRLLQVFSNLILNAVNHGTVGTPVIVTTRPDATDVRISIHNQGAISPELMPTLFDPFRGNRIPSSRSSGLGLGLYISKQILIEHNGALELESDLTRGTVFTACLPR